MSQNHPLGTTGEAFQGGRMDRRQLIRRLMAAGLSASAIGAFLSACGGSPATTSTPATQTGAAATKSGAPASGSATSATVAATVGAVGTPKRGGQIVMAQQGDWTGFDPHRQNSACLFNYIYDSLVNWEAQPDGGLKTAPALATEWQLTDNAAVLKLRQGVKFHDGSDFNADVVKFNIERMKDAKSAAKAYVASITSVDVVDLYTVRLNLTGPVGPILSNLSQAADSHGFMISKAMAE